MSEWQEERFTFDLMSVIDSVIPTAPKRSCTCGITIRKHTRRPSEISMSVLRAF